MGQNGSGLGPPGLLGLEHLERGDSEGWGTEIRPIHDCCFQLPAGRTWSHASPRWTMLK